MLAENGSIEGEVRAPVVMIDGRREGDVHATERVELAAKARVQGNVHYRVVEMHAGAQVTGRLVHADARGPVRRSADAEAAAPDRPLRRWPAPRRPLDRGWAARILCA